MDRSTVVRLRRWHAALVAGVRADEALRVLADEEPDAAVRESLIRAAGALAGARLGEVHTAFPGPMPACVRALIAAGLIGGSLGDALAAAADIAEAALDADEARAAALWWQTLAALYELGVPLPTILEEPLCEPPFPPHLREAAVLLCEDVRAGLTLAEAMARQPGVFSSLECAAVAAAEREGALGEVCRRIAAAGPALCLQAPARVSDAQSGPPEVAAVVAILEEAVRRGATEAHLQPQEDSLRVRLRVDGTLCTLPVPEGAAHLARQAVLALKAWAGMNALRRRGIQTTGVSFPRAGDRPGTHTLRVTFYGTQWGQAASVAILPRAAEVLSLDGIGLAPDQLEQVRRLLRQPCGLLALAGPMGSGRRTTAYALLSAIVPAERSVFSLESAIEQDLPGVEQVQTIPEKGLDYADALHGLLTQDPDVLYVASAADRDTLAASIEVALTGHLVIGTIEDSATAADALDTLLRLAPDRALIPASLLGVVAQRSLRLVCTTCCRRETATNAEREALVAAGVPPETIHEAGVARAVGCAACRNTGYRGRTAVFEVLPFEDAELRRLVATGAPTEEICRRLGGSKELVKRAAEKVAAGLTTIEEAARATGL